MKDPFDSEVGRLCLALQTKLDVVLSSQDLNPTDRSAGEKEYLVKFRDNLENFLQHSDFSSNKQRLYNRADVRAALQSLLGRLDCLDSFARLKESDILMLRDLLAVVEDVLLDFKNVCAVRSQCLEVTYKLLLRVFNSTIERVLSFGSNNEKNIWLQVKKMNSTIEKEIEKNSQQLAESRRKEEDWKRKVDLAKKESWYLAKMVNSLSELNKKLMAQARNLELEKAVLTNELANAKLESLQPKPSSKSPTLKSATATIMADSTHIRWLKIRDALEEQYKVKTAMISDFQREMDLIIHNGLERVKRHEVKYEDSIREVCTSTEDLATRCDRATQTTLLLVESNSKKRTTEAHCQADLLDLVIAEQADALAVDKVSARYSLQYQLKECIKLKEVVDNFLLSTKSHSHSHKQDISAMLKAQHSFILVPTSLAERISDALESVDSLKLKFNSIGETLVNLKEQNKKLQANNYEYENQNHDMTKTIEDLRKKLDDAAKLPRSDPLKHIDILENMDRSLLVEVLADFAKNLKDRLFEAASKGSNSKSTSERFLDVLSSPGKNRKPSPDLASQFERAFASFVEFKPEGICE